MKLLAACLADYWRLVALALVLAAINQVFSLLDPLIFRQVIDDSTAHQAGGVTLMRPPVPMPGHWRSPAP